MSEVQGVPTKENQLTEVEIATKVWNDSKSNMENHGRICPQCAEALEKHQAQMLCTRGLELMTTVAQLQTQVNRLTRLQELKGKSVPRCGFCDADPAQLIFDDAKTPMPGGVLLITRTVMCSNCRAVFGSSILGTEEPKSDFKGNPTQKEPLKM